MNKNSVLLFVISISLISAGCQHGSGFSPGKAGVIAGAAIGAVTGYVVSDKNKKLWALGGAAAGAWLGSQIGQHLEEKDQQKMVETSQKTVITGEKQTWSNPEKKVSGSAEVVSEKTETVQMPVKAGETEVQTVTATRTCRTIKQIIKLSDGSEKEQEITACQGPNGWETMN